MSSPSQRRGGCGHMMAGFDLHSVCAPCHDKKKGKDPCVDKPDSECQHCKVLTPKQLAQLSTPSYKLKKEKQDRSDTTPSKNPSSTSSTSVTLSPTLVDPAQVSVIRAVDGKDTVLSAQPAEKKKKVEEKKKSVKPKSAQNQGMLGHPGAVRMILLRGESCNFSTTLPKMAAGGKAYASRSSHGRLSASTAVARGSCTGDTKKGNLLLNLMPNRSIFGQCHLLHIAWKTS